MLTPGAGAGSDHAALVSIDRALAADGITVDRVDFPYRLAGRRAPDRPPVLIATVVDAARALAERLGVGPDRIALGGRSMGGRMCSMAVVAASSSSGVPNASLVPETNRQGTAIPGKWSVRSRSGLPGGCRG